MMRLTLRFALSVVALRLTCACSAAPVRYAVTDLGTLPVCSEGWGLGINNAGQAVGEAWKINDDSLAVLYAGGNLINLNTVLAPHSGWILTNAAAINSRGQIVGEGLHNQTRRAYLYQNGTVTDLGVLPNGQGSFATGLSDSGEITGYSFSQSQIHASLYSHGKMTLTHTSGYHDGVMPDAGFPINA